MNDDLSGKVALVTGGNRGIGLEVAQQLVGLNATVLIGARDPAKGEAAVGKVGAAGAVELDVADRASVGTAFERIGHEHGRLDVLINNAGINYDTWQTAASPDWAVVEDTFTTNLFGAWACAAAALPLMRANRWGRLVNVSSGSGQLSSMGAGPPAYATSKAALNALTRVLAAETLGSGVLVNAVCPGWVATDMGGPGGGPVEPGGASVVWAVTLPDDGPTGGFFRHGERLDW